MTHHDASSWLRIVLLVGSVVCRVKFARAAQRVARTLKEGAEILAEIPPMCPDLEKWTQAGQRLVTAGQERITELESTVDEFRTFAFLRS